MLRREIAPRIDHLHARIGTPQAPQVAAVGAPSVALAAERFYSWWEDVWSAHISTRGADAVLTATIEYGPHERCGGAYVGYTPPPPPGLELLPGWSLSEADEAAAHASVLESAREGLGARFEAWSAKQ